MSLKGLGIPLEDSFNRPPRLRYLVPIAILWCVWAGAFIVLVVPWIVETQRYLGKNWFGWGGIAGLLAWTLFGVLMPPLYFGRGKWAIALSLVLAALMLVAVYLVAPTG